MSNNPTLLMQRLRVIYLFVIILMSTSALSAQTVLPYPLDTIDGKVYYRYTVERSIGLYRISKNFGVSQEEILQANPHLQHSGLRYDEVILVPAKGLEVSSTVATPIKEETSAPTMVADKGKKPIMPRRRWQEEKQPIVVVADTVIQLLWMQRDIQRNMAEQNQCIQSVRCVRSL